MLRTLTLIVATLLPSVAVAHPNHAGAGDFGVLHFVTDPFHVGLSGAAILLVFAARRAMLRQRASRADL